MILPGRRRGPGRGGAAGAGRDQYRKSVFHGAAETPFALAALGNDAGM